MNAQDYMVLRSVAPDLNTTNQRLGQILEEQGYRRLDGMPTELAKARAMAVKFRLDCGRIGIKWHKPTVLELVRALEEQCPGTITPRKIPRKTGGDR